MHWNFCFTRVKSENLLYMNLAKLVQDKFISSRQRARLNFPSHTARHHLEYYPNRSSSSTDHRRSTRPKRHAGDLDPARSATWIIRRHDESTTHRNQIIHSRIVSQTDDWRRRSLCYKNSEEISRKNWRHWRVGCGFFFANFREHLSSFAPSFSSPKFSVVLICALFYFRHLNATNPVLKYITSLFFWTIWPFVFSINILTNR
jgi:hypothetical protein